MYVLSLLVLSKYKLYLWSIYLRWSTDFKNVAIIYVEKSAYRVILTILVNIKLMNKLMNKFNLVGKTGDIYCND